MADFRLAPKQFFLLGDERERILVIISFVQVLKVP